MSLAVDLLLVAVFTLFVYVGVRRGLLIPTLRIVRLIISSAVAVRFGSVLASRLEAFLIPTVTEKMSREFTTLSGALPLLSHGIALFLSVMLGYGVLFLLSFSVLSLIIRVMDKLVRLPVLKTLDRVLGFGSGIAVGGLVLTLCSVLCRIVLISLGREDVVESSLLLSLFPRP